MSKLLEFLWQVWLALCGLFNRGNGGEEIDE